MIVTVLDEQGNTIDYDLKDLKDSKVKSEANSIIEKVGQLEVVQEALRFSVEAHKLKLEQLLKHTK